MSCFIVDCKLHFFSGFRASVRKNLEYLKAVTRDTSTTVIQILRNSEIIFKRFRKSYRLKILWKNLIFHQRNIRRLENILNDKAKNIALVIMPFQYQLVVLCITILIPFQVTFLGWSGGKSSSQMANRMLSRLLSNKVGSNITWSGNSVSYEKNKFKENLLIFSSICGMKTCISLILVRF